MRIFESVGGQGGDVAGLQAELERLASLASPDNKAKKWGHCIFAGSHHRPNVSKHSRPGETTFRGGTTGNVCQPGSSRQRWCASRRSRR